MAWLTKDKDGTEVLWVCELKPLRYELQSSWGYDDDDEDGRYFEFPDGTFESAPKWNEEPIKI